MPRESFTDRPFRFTDDDVVYLTRCLEDVDAIVGGLAWEFTDDDALVIDYLVEDRVRLSHPKTARAFLNAWLDGYNYAMDCGSRKKT